MSTVSRRRARHARRRSGRRRSARAPSRAACGLRRFGGGFGLRFALLARHGLLGVIALLALLHAGGIEETHHAVGWLCALGKPGLDLVHVELQPGLAILRQQRVEVAETLDEAAVARKARVGGDDVIDRTLLGARASEADDDWHFVLLLTLKLVMSVNSSLRGAKRRSNPYCRRWRHGLLRCARNDG